MATVTPFDQSAVMYAVHKRHLTIGGKSHLIFVCECLTDHHCMGVGTTRQEAIDEMSAAVKSKYDASGEMRRAKFGDN